MFLLKDTTQWRRWGSNPFMKERVNLKPGDSKNTYGVAPQALMINSRLFMVGGA